MPLQPIQKEFKYDNPQSAAAEEGIIRLLFLDQGICRGKPLPEEDKFSSPVLAKIYSVLKTKIDNGEIVSTAAMGAVLSPEESALLAHILQKPEALRNGEKALSDYIERITDQHDLSVTADDLLKLQKRLKETKGYEG